MMSSPSSSRSPLEELELSHYLSFFGSGKVSRELSEDSCLVLLLLSNSLKSSSLKSSTAKE